MAEPSLRNLAARRIIAHVADAAARWCDADFPPRVRATAAIVARLGYSMPVVEHALDRLFFGCTAAAFEAAIGSELGSVESLDGPVPRAGAPAGWARGVEQSVIVASDTTIGVALIPALFALCAKSSVVVKDRSDDLVSAFFATLNEEHPAFVDAARALRWIGGDAPEEDRLFAAADVVLAFGRDDALRAIRARCGVETRFVPFAHRVSIGRLSAAAVDRFDDALAAALMRDALLYDAEGCLSLHALFVAARGEQLERVIAILARAAERVAVEFPAGARSPQRSAAIAAARGLARFRSAAGGNRVLTEASAGLVVELDALSPPPLLPGILPVIASDDDAVARYLVAHRLPVQALAIERVDAAAVALAARIGAVRVCAFGTMQDPPLAGHHGGEPRIASFVRWIDER